MLKLKANDLNKTLKDEFVDVTLNELATAYKYIQGLDSDLKHYLLSKGEKEIPESKLFEFKIHWITLFSDFTKEELRLIPMEGSISVEWLYKHCEQFMKQPESYVQLKEFDHKKVTYKLIEPLTTISGAELLFGKANFRQFMLGSQLTSMVEANKQQTAISSLVQLFALLYSDGEDSSEEVVKRSKVFGEVNALYGWSAYFFFVELVERYKDYFHLSTTENPPAQIQRLSARQQLKALLSKTTFGSWLLSKLRKKEFSILTT
jgi:hypothetical protein